VVVCTDKCQKIRRESFGGGRVIGLDDVARLIVAPLAPVVSCESRECGVAGPGRLPCCR